MTERHTEQITFLWHSDWLTIRIAVIFRRNYFSGYDHLEIRSVEPEKHPLPITETGYRSIFAVAGDIDQLGGSVEAARILLDDGAQNTNWQQRIAEWQQPSLF